MNTPIHDFVKTYAASAPARLHMPGHKGRGPLGCEALDITEIPGADSLYEAAGIIAESEANASRLFGCPTFYSTEGSSHCIRAMLFLAMQYARRDKHCLSAGFHPVLYNSHVSTSFRVLAARNVHRSFLTAAALLDLDLVWLPQDSGNYLTADPSPETVAAAIGRYHPDALYLTCPDYLGCLPDLRPLAGVCHARGVLLLVDNAHGAYLRFLQPSLHPMDRGADLCCDSAHKTLPVLTGGAYLHVSQRLLTAAEAKALPPMGGRPEGPDAVQTAGGRVSVSSVRDALALFGSTSPSYLILQSLDLANPYLERLPTLLDELVPKIDALKRELAAAGYLLYGQEALKLTLCPASVGLSGTELAKQLETENIFCEFADPDFLVLMLSPNTPEADLARLRSALLAPVQAAGSGQQATVCPPADDAHPSDPQRSLVLNSQFSILNFPSPAPVCSLRAAMLSPCVRIPAAESLGRILARPGVSCPPAVPILMPGERIDEAALAAFRHYGVGTLDVLDISE